MGICAEVPQVLSDLKSTKVIASAGVLALGMAGLRGANVTGLTPQETTKRWSVTASLGMFYDDNNLNSPTKKEPSFGAELNSRLSLNLPLERTLIKASYDLRLDYYEVRRSGPVDQEHSLDLNLNHHYSERSELRLGEVFVSATQPEVSSGNNAQTTFQRGDRGNYSHIRNYFNADYNVRMSPIFGLAVGLRNSTYDYQQSGTRSLSALLDRTENELRLEGQLYPSKRTRLFTGYEFGATTFTGAGILGFDSITVTNGVGTNSTTVTLLKPVRSSVRDTVSHYFYVGGERIFSPRLTGEIRVGTRYTDYYNQGLSEMSPYMDLGATSYFLPGSSVTLGAKVDRNTTDNGLGQKGLTRDQLSATLFSDLRHRFSRRATGTFGLRFQHSIFNGGDFDGMADDYMSFGPGFEYLIGQNLYGVLSFSREQLFSSVPNRGFDKNRVTLSLRAVF
jgi:hypothetical protein